jgi:hypothetical protein
MRERERRGEREEERKGNGTYISSVDLSISHFLSLTLSFSLSVGANYLATFIALSSPP